MTDAEVVTAVAEKVMGWEHTAHLTLDHDGRGKQRFSVASATGQVWRPKVFVEWNPLTNDSAVCEVLDKMAADGFCPEVRANDEGEWFCEYWAKGAAESDYVTIGPEPRRRAICLAALRAYGIDPDT